MNDSVQVGGGYVESPEMGASEGILIELERRASAAVAEINQTAGLIQSETAFAAGQMEEGRKAEAGEEAEAKKEGAVQSTAESRVATEAITNAMAPGLQVAVAGVEALSEERSNPKNAVDTKAIEKQTGGMVGRQATSFEDMNKKIKSNPNGNLDKVSSKIQSNKTGAGVCEKSEIAAKSLKGQGSCVASWKKMEESSGGLSQTRDYAMSMGVANEKVLSQIQAVRAQKVQQPQTAPQQPGPAGLTNDKMAQGPTFKEPVETTTDGSESWA